MSLAAAGFLSGLTNGYVAGREIEDASGGQRKNGLLEWLGLRDPASQQGPSGDERLGGEVGGRGIEGPVQRPVGQTDMGPNTRQSTTSSQAGGERMAAQAAMPGEVRLKEATIDIDPRLEAAIAEAAGKYGEDPRFFRRLSEIESAGGTRLKNESSSARGPWQFVTGTAEQYGLADPYDFATSTDAVMRLTADNRKALKDALGRDPTFGELYLAHQQGGGGASALLRDPTMSAIDALTPVYKGNRKRARSAVLLNGGGDDMTAGEFASRWVSKFDEPADQQPGASVARAFAAAGKGR